MNGENGNFSFETSYEKLEKILARLNSCETSLEKSLELYEEATKLITLCSAKLNRAEQKIEMLIKNREGALQTIPYTPEPADDNRS
ncbi:MAG: exodeoxyribonuclease VII small subunit [Chlamydiota bacterium]